MFDWDEYLLGEAEIDATAELDSSLTFPAPYFGGKRRAAALIWERIGDVANWVEPLGGTGAVLLARPAEHRARVETLNDLDGLLVNVHRALRADPFAVADVCDYPVAEVDLHARHRALVAARADLSARLEADPHYFDAEMAGFWLWGASAWIGPGWCADREPSRKIPILVGGADDARPQYGKGVHSSEMRKRLPDIGGGRHWNGVDMQPRPGKGVHRDMMRRQLPDLGGSTKGDDTFVNVGKGVNAASMREPSRQIIHMGDAGTGVHNGANRSALHDTFARIAARLRYVRFPCGDWTRVVTPAVTWRHGLTGILFDPPYADGAVDYAVGGRVSADVRAWCAEHWDDRLPNGEPAYRLALCGYEGEHDDLERTGWEVVAWKAAGGYGNRRKNGVNDNARRERIWFSPHCVKPRAAQPSLFDLIGAA